MAKQASNKQQSCMYKPVLHCAAAYQMLYVSDKPDHFNFYDNADSCSFHTI